MVSQKDVAQLANVSFMTVSRVINGHPYVQKETRERVLRAIEKLDYYPNATARSLNQNKSNAIGIILPKIQTSLATPYFVQLLYYAEKELSKYGYSPLIISGDSREEMDYSLLFKERRVDGLILIAASFNGNQAKAISDRNIPVVLVHGRSDVNGICYVDINNKQATTIIMNYFFNLGHKKIGIITGDLQSINALERLKSYKDFLSEKGLPIEDNLIFEGDWTSQAGYEGFRYFNTMQKPPTGIFCSNDHMAIGAIKYAHDNNIKVPSDYSIIGFDDIEMASYVSPAVTTVRQPFEEIAYNSVDILLTRLHNPNSGCSNKILNFQFIERESCSYPRR